MSGDRCQTETTRRPHTLAAGVFLRNARSWLAVVAVVALWLAWAADATAAADAAQALRDRESALALQLQRNAFQQPLVMESGEGGGRASGDVYALLPHPFAAARAALVLPAQWCDVLILHLNVKHCGARPAGLAVSLGLKQEQPLNQAFRLELAYRVVADSPEYLHLQMDAGSGPLGTRDYRIELEAVPANGSSSFVHFHYEYGYGMAAGLAMRGYLSTVGRGKVGFSTISGPDGKTPVLVGGTRGAVERNTMRYYLAIAAYLDSLSVPAAERPEQRLRDWFNATERYAMQLHELDRDEYLGMKRNELRRQQTPGP